MEKSRDVFKTFKGTNAQYQALHTLMRPFVPNTGTCAICEQPNHKLDLANISHEYTEDPNDWEYLCKTCHMKYDSPKYRRVGDEWEKRCTRCELFLPESAFYQRKGTKWVRGKEYENHSYTALCKSCTSEWSKERNLTRSKNQKDECRRGHKLTEENTCYEGARKRCKICRNARYLTYKDKQKKS